MKMSEYASLVEEALKKQIYPGESLEGLYSPIAYGLSAGGKRLRPALVLMSAEAFGGTAGKERALSAAVGMEMFHNFTLLHDDVMDASDTRRGRPTVQAKWGVNKAILSGDTMLTLAIEKIMDVPDNLLRPILEIFNTMALRVYEGQHLDMEYENRDDITTSQYLRMIGDKTGALLGASARIGALLGGAGESTAERMAEFGEKLGLAFQIQDDWLDVYGDSVTFGKPIGGDINNGKRSYLLLKGLESGTPDSEALRAAMTLASGPLKVKTVTRIYDKLNISDVVRMDVAKYSAEALAVLKHTGLDEAAREPFRTLVDKLTGRRK